jgi:hypothetical protein
MSQILVKTHPKWHAQRLPSDFWQSE